MVLAKKNCQRVLAASLRVVSAMTGNPPLAELIVVMFSNKQAHKQCLFAKAGLAVAARIGFQDKCRGYIEYHGGCSVLWGHILFVYFHGT